MYNCFINMLIDNLQSEPNAALFIETFLFCCFFDNEDNRPLCINLRIRK